MLKHTDRKLTPCESRLSTDGFMVPLSIVLAAARFILKSPPCLRSPLGRHT
jgi:hypothetical protein